jgi:ribonuclease HII
MTAKQLSENKKKLGPIIEKQTLAFLFHLEPNVIDKINILNASIKAMQECVLKLSHNRYIIVDGNTLLYIKELK